MPGLSERAFAVFPEGQSLSRLGLEEGMLLYCDPTYEVSTGDFLYLEKKEKDGLTLCLMDRFRAFLSVKGEPCLSLKGAYEKRLKPKDTRLDKKDEQTKPNEQVDIQINSLITYAPVVYIRRKI